MGAQGVHCIYSSINMTTTTKTTVPTTKTTKPTKAALKKITAEKKKAGKKAQSATGKKNALAMKKAGKGIFAPKKLSDALAAVCGAKTLPRTEVTKKVWVYIKKHGLNNGRTIKPDATLKAIFPVPSLDMLKMAGHISKHLA